MPDFTLQQANRAAAGIRPVVTVPTRSGTATVNLYCKAPKHVLATIAKLRDKRLAPKVQPVGGQGRGGVFLNPQLLRSQAQLHIDPHVLQQPVLIPRPLGGDPLTLTPDLLMTSSVLGQFVIENAAGRTAISRSIVDFVKTSGSRHGLDALLLTALLQLENVHDAGFADALTVWRNTIPSAGSTEHGDSGVIFSPHDGGLTSVKTPVFVDPFQGGVCAPQVVQHMQQLAGGDAMIGAAVIVVIYAVVGGAKGAIDAYGKGGGAADIAKGFGSGMIDGVIAGFKEVGGFIGSLIGYFTKGDKDDSKDKQQAPLDDNTGKDVTNLGTPTGPSSTDTTPTTPTTPTGGSTDTTPTTPTGTPTSPGGDPSPTPGDPGGNGGGGTDPDPVPPPSGSMPAPDDDGGSGPWALVGTSPLLPVAQARSMVLASTGPVFAVAQLPGVLALQSAFNTQSSLLGQMHALTSVQATLNQVQLASFRNASQTIAGQIAGNAHLGDLVAAQQGIAAR